MFLARHHDIECVRDQGHCQKGLKDPFEKCPCLEICQIVMLDDHALEPICDLFKDTLHEPPPSLRKHAEQLRHPGQKHKQL